jgi:hypothetical protein
VIAAIRAAFQALLAIMGIPRWVPVVGLAGAIGMGGAYFYGKHVAAQACQEASLRTEIATLNRDFAAWKAADEIEAMLDKDLQADRQQLEQEVKNYEIALKSRPEPNCTLTDADVGAVGRVPGKRKH